MHDMRATIRLVSVALAVTVMAGPALEAKTVRARVIGDGRGVEGATVRLFFDETTSPWGSGLQSDELDFAVESITDADGAVELTYEDPLSLKTLYRIHVEVEAVGWATLRLPVRDDYSGIWELPEVLRLGALPLRRGHRLEGRVVSASGSPVTGAMLIVVEEVLGEIEWPNDTGWLTASHLPGAVTDAEGRFVLPLLKAGSYRVAVDAADYEGTTRTVEVAPGAGPTILQLAKSLPLTGRILDSAGRGLPDIDLTLRSSDDNIESLIGDLDTGISDGDGRFRFDRGPSGPGSVTLDISDPACRIGYLYGSLSPTAEQLVVRQRGGLRLDEPIRCLPPTELVVAVHDSDGEPIEGAEISLHEERDLQASAGPVGFSETHFLSRINHLPRGTTEADGTATFYNLRPGPITVSVALPGYENRTVNGRVSLTSENPTALEVELEAVETRELEVRVEDHQGRPVSGPLLEVVSYTETGYASRECILAEDGRCTIDLWPVALHDLELVLVSAEHDEYHDEYTARTPAPGEPLLVTLPPPERPRLTVTGRIVDRHGQPVRSARLESWRFKDAPRFVDENGAFELHRVTEGRLEIEASAPGFADFDDLIEIRRGTAEVTIVLQPAVRIRGRLSGRDAGSGAASPETEIWARRDGAYLLRAAVSGDGYTIDGAYPGQWQLQAEVNGTSVVEPVEIPEGVSEVVVDLELPPVHRLRGTITIDGEPLRAGYVQLRSGEPEKSLFLTVGEPVRAGFVSRPESSEVEASISLDVEHENGRFETRLQSGRWRLWLLDNRGNHAREIDVQSDLDVAIELQTAPIRGRVVDSATGSGIEGITVRARPETWMRYAAEWETETATDDDGRFDFGRLLTGNWTVDLQLPKHDPNWHPVESIEPVELAADGADLDIVLAATSKLEIVARYTDGEPLPAVFVRLFTLEQHALLQAERAAGRSGRIRMEVFNAMWAPRQEVPLDAEGRGTITAAPPGRYRLEARGVRQFKDPPFSTTSTTVTIPGPRAELTFERLGVAFLEFFGLEPGREYPRRPESRATLLEPTDPAYDGPRTVDGRTTVLSLAPGQWHVETTLDGAPMACVVEVIEHRRHACVFEPD